MVSPGNCSSTFSDSTNCGLNPQVRNLWSTILRHLTQWTWELRILLSREGSWKQFATDTEMTALTLRHTQHSSIPPTVGTPATHPSKEEKWDKNPFPVTWRKSLDVGPGGWVWVLLSPLTSCKTLNQSLTLSDPTSLSRGLEGSPLTYPPSAVMNCTGETRWQSV